MKFNLTLILLLVATQSCKQKTGNDNEIGENGNRIVYNQETWYKLREKDKNLKVKIIDTSCINQKKRAKRDIEKGKLTYFLYVGMTKRYSSNKEMKKLLANFNIDFDSTLTTCFAPAPGFGYYCYEKKMQAEIEKQFGTNFIDSLRTVAKKRYVLNHPDKIFSFEDCDTIARYPRASSYKEHFENYEIDYFKSFKYPKGYQFKNEQSYSYTTAEFILHKDGSISDIIVETEFQNPENEKYKELFEKRMIEFIKRTDWIPAKKSGVTVNSKMPIYIAYK